MKHLAALIASIMDAKNHHRFWQAFLILVCLIPWPAEALLFSSVGSGGGGGGSFTLITQSQSPYFDTAATNGLNAGNATPTAGLCDWVTANNVTIPQSGAASPLTWTVAHADIVSMHVGDILWDSSSGVIQADTVIQSVNTTTNQITVNQPSSAAGTGSTSETINVNPVRVPSILPARQWDWLPAATVNQPQGADYAQGVVYATGNTASGGASVTGLVASTNVVTGVAWNLTNIVAGDIVVGPGVPALGTDGVNPVTVASYASGTATLANCTSCLDTNSKTGGYFFFESAAFPPKIVQFHTGGTATATFTGSISGTTLTITGTPPATMAAGDLVTDGQNGAAGFLALSTHIISGSGSSYTISPSQTVASESMSGWAVATTYKNLSAALTYVNDGPQNWLAGDTFLVYPAIYSDVDAGGVNQLYLQGGLAPASCSGAFTYGSNVLACSGIGGTPTVGETIYISAPALNGYYLWPGATITGGTSPNFTMSNKWVGPTTSGVTVYIMGVNDKITVAGVTQNDGGGTPTRPVIQNGRSGTNPINLGGYGTLSNFHIDNINVDLLPISPGPTVSRGIVFMGGGAGTSGTSILSNMDVEGAMFTSLGTGNPYGADDLITGNDTYYETITITGTVATGDAVTIGFYYKDNSGNGASGGSINYTTVSGDTTSDIAAKLVQSLVTQGQPTGGCATGSLTPLNCGFYAYAVDNVLYVAWNGAPVSFFERSSWEPSVASHTGSETYTITEGAKDPRGLGGTFELLYDTFAYGGGNNGPNHCNYWGDNPYATLIVKYSWYHHCYYGHSLKTRSGTVNAVGNYFEDDLVDIAGTIFAGQNSGGTSAQADFTCAGDVSLLDNVITKTYEGWPGGGNQHFLDYNTEYSYSCLYYGLNQLNIKYNTFVAFNATVDGGGRPYMLFAGGPDFQNNFSAGQTCTGGALFAGDNIIDFASTTCTSAGLPQVWAKDSTNPTYIPPKTLLKWFFPTSANGVKSWQGRTCPSGHTCFLMDHAATTAASNDTILIAADNNPHFELPGDSGWDWIFATSNAWSVKGNLFVGMCRGNFGTDNGPNAGTQYGDWPWFAPGATDSYGSVGVNINLGIGELTQKYTYGPPQYAISPTDNSNVGNEQYNHVAGEGSPALLRALATIGAMD